MSLTWERFVVGPSKDFIPGLFPAVCGQERDGLFLISKQVAGGGRGWAGALPEEVAQKDFHQ